MKLAKCKCGWQINVGDRIKAVICPACGSKVKAKRLRAKKVE